MSQDLIFEIGKYSAIAYELIVRVIPTKKNVGIIHGVLKVLLFVSTALNNSKKSLNDRSK